MLGAGHDPPSPVGKERDRSVGAVGAVGGSSRSSPIGSGAAPGGGGGGGASGAGGEGGGAFHTNFSAAATPFEVPGLARTASGGSVKSSDGGGGGAAASAGGGGPAEGSPTASPRGALRRPVDPASEPTAAAAAAAAGAPQPYGVPREMSRVSVRVNQPVQTLAAEPFTLLRDDSGELISGDDPRLSYEWQRGRRLLLCANPGCPRVAASSEQMADTGRTPVQCTHCLRHRRPVAPSLFCSAECFSKGWKAHQSFHTDGEAVAPGSSDDVPEHAGLHGWDEAVARDPSAEDDWQRWSAFLHQYRGVRYPTVTRDKEKEDDSWTPCPGGGQRDYTPTSHDVGHALRLKVTYLAGKEGEATGVSKPKFVLTMPPPPPMRSTVFGHQPIRSTVTEDHGFRIMTHNVLAEIYATQTVYPYTPMWALAWNFRRRVLLREIERSNADVLCLQEVQADHFESFYYPELTKLGYEGLYKQKTRESMGMAGKVDGCALFFRTARFNLLEKYVIEFNDAAMQMSRAEKTKLKASGKPPQVQRAQGEQLNKALQRLLKDNVAQVVVLDMIATKSGAAPSQPTRLCVSNTHVYWDPEYDDVKLWQTHMLLKELEKFTVARDLPLVLCGDFNSAPSSAVYKLFTINTPGNGARRPEGLPREDYPKDPCDILQTRGKLTHNLPLMSGYKALAGEEPPFTNYTGHFVGCLDYAWFSANRLQVVAGLALPTGEELRELSGTPLPNKQWSSDHLSLVFDMMPHSHHAGAGAAAGAGVGAGGSTGAAGAGAGTSAAGGGADRPGWAGPQQWSGR